VGLKNNQSIHDNVNDMEMTALGFDGTMNHVSYAKDK